MAKVVVTGMDCTHALCEHMNCALCNLGTLHVHVEHILMITMNYEPGVVCMDSIKYVQ